MEESSSGSVDSLKRGVTIYSSEVDNVGKTKAGTWGQLSTLIAVPHQTRREKRGARAFSPGVLSPGTTRSSDNVILLSMAVADIDNSIPFDDIKPLISEYEWIAHSSHGHNPPEVNKYRIIFPLSRNCARAEWGQVWDGFNQFLGGRIDTQCKDPSRLYFLPCCPEERKHLAFHASNNGTLMDVDYLKSLAPAEIIIPTVKTDWSLFGMSVSKDMVSVEYPDSSLSRIADHCAHIAKFRDTGGDSEPLWYAALGLAKHCIDGPALAHEWASKYDGYSKHETQGKMDQWGYGPPTCSKLSSIDSSACGACAYLNKVTSPIQLGYVAEQKAPAVNAVQEGASATDEAKPFTPEHWPKNASVTNGVMRYLAEDENGVLTPVPFATPMFWPVERVRTEDGTYCFHMAMEVRKGAPLRYFDIPIKSIVDGKSLRMALASYECIVFNDKLAVKFMSDYSTLMRQLRDETHTHTQFGWTSDKFDSFLIGDTLISKEVLTNVRLSDKVFNDDLRKAYDVRGTKEQWIKGVDTIYNVPNGEPYQYVICTAFGSPLVPLMNFDDWNGIPLAITTDESALGKSTVSKIAINAISNAKDTHLSQVTALAVSVRASKMGSLITLFDEMSDKDGVDSRGMLYSLSNGKPKVALLSDGSERKTGGRWKLNSIITGNRNFFFNLTEIKDNPEAVQLRVLEIDLLAYPPIESFKSGADPEYKALHREIAMDLQNNTSCVFSAEFIQYIIKHKDEIKERLLTVSAAISKALGDGSQKERFYVYHMACTLVGGAIAKKLGFINFNLTGLKNWAFNHILKLRELSVQNRNTPADLLSDMLADLHGHFIVTRRFETLNSRSGITELPMFPVKTPVAGRIVLGSGDTEYPRVFVTAKAVAEWCKDHGYSLWQVRKSFEDANLLRHHNKIEGTYRRRDRNISIGRGVQGVSLGEPRCLEFSYAAAQGYLESLGPGAKVIEFPALAGVEEVTGVSDVG